MFKFNILLFLFLSGLLVGGGDGKPEEFNMTSADMHALADTLEALNTFIKSAVPVFVEASERVNSGEQAPSPTETTALSRVWTGLKAKNK
jgi:hypothetical protein